MKKILVIEDNDLLISTIKAMLSNLKKEFIIANSAQEGIDLYREQYQNISIIICDMFLHDITGAEVYKAIYKINPSIKMILSSGALYDSEIEELLNHKNIKFLQKPYTMQDLANTLEQFDIK